MTQLSSQLAQQILDHAETYANGLGVSVCIALVDDGAHLYAFRRMDMSFKGAIDVSIRKAKTSALFPFESGRFGEIIQDKSLMGMELSNDGLACFPGGIPMTYEDKPVGAIGVSGASAAQDAEIAEYALKQVGLL